MNTPDTTELAQRSAVVATGNAINYVASAHPILIQKIKSEIDSFMSGKIDVDAIMVEIRANQEKLDGCAKPHEFELDRLNMLGKRTCKKCGGKLAGYAAVWYERGLKDAK